MLVVVVVVGVVRQFSTPQTVVAFFAAAAACEHLRDFLGPVVAIVATRSILVVVIFNLTGIRIDANRNPNVIRSAIATDCDWL